MVNEFIHGLRPNLTASDGDTMFSAAAARPVKRNRYIHPAVAGQQQ